MWLPPRRRLAHREVAIAGQIRAPPVHLDRLVRCVSSGDRYEVVTELLSAVGHVEERHVVSDLDRDLLACRLGIGGRLRASPGQDATTTVITPANDPTTATSRPVSMARVSPSSLTVPVRHASGDIRCRWWLGRSGARSNRRGTAPVRDDRTRRDRELTCCLWASGRRWARRRGRRSRRSLPPRPCSWRSAQG